MGDWQTKVSGLAVWVHQWFEEQTLIPLASTGMRSSSAPIQTSHYTPPSSRLASAETIAPYTDTPPKTAPLDHNFPPTWKDPEQQLSYTVY